MADKIFKVRLQLRNDTEANWQAIGNTFIPLAGEACVTNDGENKDYCPENCQWIPLPKNSAKKSTTHYVTVYNETHSGREWSHILHKGVNFINTRVRKYGLNNIIEYIKSHCVWKDGRVVECNGLESRQPQLGFADSNSAPSAK